MVRANNTHQKKPGRSSLNVKKRKTSTYCAAKTKKNVVGGAKIELVDTHTHTNTHTTATTRAEYSYRRVKFSLKRSSFSNQPLTVLLLGGC